MFKPVMYIFLSCALHAEEPGKYTCNKLKFIHVKGKVRPRTGQEGPEEEQMYNSTLPSTSALDAGGWSTSRPGRLTPGKDPVPIV